MEQLKSQFNKLYFEYYAKYSMVLSCDKKYNHLKKGESPDWQSERLDIGVEVTRAIAKDICLAYDIIVEYFGNGCDEAFYGYSSDINYINCREENEGQISIDDISNIENLKNIYIQKTEKLNKNYTQYSKNLLYMFTFRTMDESEVAKCFEADTSKYKLNYDLCLINCFDRLYVCSFIDKSIIQTIHVPQRILNKLKNKAYKKSKI
ncbi:MAG: hypothetical protein AB1Z23_00320 [Eubacteriales bacterium]